jgi:ElaB/YqjD/DUF883 family membrane-anchored ribosome-binding protein
MHTKTRHGSEIAEHAQNAAEEIQSTGAAAWDRAKDIYQSAQDSVVNGAKVADRSIRQNPYQAVGIAFGVGLLAGFLLRRK